MDAASGAGARGGPFHYSPLKLAEYLAAAVPVVAPAVGQLSERLTDGVDAVLVPPHDTPALVAALQTPADGRRRARPHRTSRTPALASATWSWDQQVRRVLAALPRRSSAAFGCSSACARGCVGRTPDRGPMPLRSGRGPEGEDSGLLSVVVVVHDMARELPRTLRSLSPRHQIGIWRPTTTR